ncbi:unnamed protein product [Peronospora belbahrii]|uniref:Rab proteins geranylgeranyltransferase component n=1 Tax=Peronospora belbahrii TaxID=622444 RepID=A0ABN8CRM7_9STRA|nr:unnamed protein product [Peronospora belbahrii]
MDALLKETEYDIVLIGTGIVESILAGALARIGKKVLHLDQNDYYGSNYASFTLRKHRILLMKSSFTCHLLDERFANETTKEELLRQSSCFNIDVNPRLMLSSEQLVETLIASGVGRYLEFAAIERTYVHFQPSVSGTQQLEKDLKLDTVWEVPCSKKDVFQSKLLNTVEKRQLMKFLQFVADYGETHILHEDVKTKNERMLALGRALKRPQNKINQVDGDTMIAAYVERPFQELLEKHFKLSTKLQMVVVYCVGLATFPATKNQISARDGLAAVYRYVASIGRFTVDGFVLNAGTNVVSGVHCSDGSVLRTKHVVTNGSYAGCLRLTDGETLPRVHGQILRGAFVLNTSLRDGMNRIVLIIPPEDSEFCNPFAIQVVQLDAGAYACPRGYFLVQISMPLPAEWLNQMKKQRELLQSVIRRLILSSETELHQKQNKADAKMTFPQATSDDITETEAATNIAQTSAASVDTSYKPNWSNRIAWQAIFTMDHIVSSDDSNSSAHTKNIDLPANVWVCETPPFDSDCNLDPIQQKSCGNAARPLEIHLESANANARAIFEVLCPGEPFLPKSASAEQAEQDEQEDEENAVLRAARKLALQTQLKGKQTVSSIGGVTESQAVAIVEKRGDNDEVSRVSEPDTSSKEGSHELTGLK